MGHVTANDLPKSSLLYQQPAGLGPDNFGDGSAKPRPLLEAPLRARFEALFDPRVLAFSHPAWH